MESSLLACLDACQITPQPAHGKGQDRHTRAVVIMSLQMVVNYKRYRIKKPSRPQWPPAICITRS